MCCRGQGVRPRHQGLLRSGGSKFLKQFCPARSSRQAAGRAFRMKIRIGFEMLYDFPRPTPMIMVLGTHFTRASDVIVPDFLTTSPAVEITPYRDMFGNWCTRMVAPAGRVRLAADGVVRDSGLPDPVFASASQLRSKICPLMPWSICSAAAIA